jgi:hypothetical protein
MALRVLCLHDKDSCAPELILRLRELGARLYHKHGIELAFANSPLVSNRTTPVTTTSSNDSNASSSGDSSNNEAKDHDSIGRVWYYENKSGLDASILHLRQLWQQSFYSAPFHIVLGIGQGAAMASMLPFLTWEEGPNEERKLMFEGLSGCIFINGWDLLSSNGDNDQDIQKYEEVSNLSSLHIFNPESQSSNLLFKRYGDKSEFCAMQSTKFNGKIFNSIGNFLVKRKNAQHGSALVVRTRNELAIVEQKALDVINRSVSANPPKALMAMITPDSSRGGTLFGGWIGDKDEFRSEEFKESGGAPFPGSSNQVSNTSNE